MTWRRFPPLISFAIAYLAGPSPAMRAAVAAPQPPRARPEHVCSHVHLFAVTPEQRARWAAEHTRKG